MSYSSHILYSCCLHTCIHKSTFSNLVDNPFSICTLPYHSIQSLSRMIDIISYHSLHKSQIYRGNLYTHRHSHIGYPGIVSIFFCLFQIQLDMFHICQILCMFSNHRHTFYRSSPSHPQRSHLYTCRYLMYQSLHLYLYTNHILQPVSMYHIQNRKVHNSHLLHMLLFSKHIDHPIAQSFLRIGNIVHSIHCILSSQTRSIWSIDLGRETSRSNMLDTCWPLDRFHKIHDTFYIWKALDRSIFQPYSLNLSNLLVHRLQTMELSNRHTIENRYNYCILWSMAHMNLFLHQSIAQSHTYTPHQLI